MKIKTVRLDEETKNILIASKIEGNRLTLSGQLDRAAYMKVVKAIEAAGGKWSRKDACHIFPHDVRETLNLNADSVEVMDVQQIFQSFNTPQAVADKMVGLADLTAGDRVLEPSAGTGNLVRAAISAGVFRSDITAVEIDPKKANALSVGCVICGDFLTCTESLRRDWRKPEGQFDRILMNPPFSRGQDIAHIKHAMQFLAPGGRLVAVCANGPRQRVELDGPGVEWIDLPPGSFKESGTNVDAAIVVIEKEQVAA